MERINGITINEAEAFLEVFGGDDALVSIVRVRPEDAAVASWHKDDVSPGLYAYFEEYPEEGSIKIGE